MFAILKLVELISKYMQAILVGKRVVLLLCIIPEGNLF